MAAPFDILILLLFVVLPLIGLITGVVLWIVGARQSANGRGMSCGRCGYSVAGLTQLMCPECGADLREVGIVSAAASPAMRIIGMVLTFVCLGVLLLVILAAAVLLA